MLKMRIALTLPVTLLLLAAASASTTGPVIITNTPQSVFQKQPGQPPSILPLPLQELVIRTVTEKCQPIVKNYGLTEIETVVEGTEVIDALGSLNFYYLTTLRASYYDSDGMHPRSTTISVRSIQVGLDLPNNIAVISVESPSDQCMGAPYSQ